MDRYDLIKIVGTGTYGKALLCRRRVDNKKCIIKQITTFKLSKKEIQATELEAALLARLQHPNVISFWESFKTSDSLCIVMEFADAGDLDQFLKGRKGRLLSESEVLRIFIQIALAIKHIHDRKILHRDLKSQVSREKIITVTWGFFFEILISFNRCVEYISYVIWFGKTR